MGNYIASLTRNTVLGLGGSKRKIEEVLLDDSSSKSDSVLHASKRRKLMSTSQYIYKTLFEEGKDSDVTVVALGQQWHLHKVYLSQSPYFCSMFSGNWREAYESIIHIKILDETITIESLSIVLGSFYKDDVVIEATHIIPVLATAVLLQMDPIIDLCSFVMKETINIKTVLDYHNASCQYGIVNVQQSCKNWLLLNLLTQVTESPSILRKVSTKLMEELISSPELYVMQTEFSVYVMLKAWVFLNFNDAWDGTGEETFLEAHKFFKNREEEGYFLEEEGHSYANVFHRLRFSHLIYHYLDVEMINNDRILPLSWLQPAAMKQWYNMLRTDQDKDKGPSDISEEVFNANCSRCGRVITVNSQHIWRWTGYNFGLDIVMTYDNFSIKLKRNHRIETSSNAPHQAKRKIMYKVTVASLSDQKQVTYLKKTGMKGVTLNRNEEIKVLELDRDVQFPLVLSASFLVTTPSGFLNTEIVQKT